jgi:hypothetical protein
MYSPKQALLMSPLLQCRLIWILIFFFKKNNKKININSD